MKIEVIEVTVADLRIGDEWHDDKWAAYPGRARRMVRSTDGCLWKVINTPFGSNNAQLFWDAPHPHACYVVPVEYMDGARGSRLFDYVAKLLVRRDLQQKEA